MPRTTPMTAMLLVVAGLAVVSCAGTPSRDIAARIRYPAGAFAELPLHLLRGGLPAVDVRAGDRTLRLVIDTGSTHALLALRPDVLADLGIEPGKSAGWTMDSQGRRIAERCFTMPRLAVGDSVVTNLPGVTESSPALAAIPADGMLTLPFLRHFLVLLDYRAGFLRLYRPDAVPAELAGDGWKTVAFRLHSRVGMLVEGRLGSDGDTLALILDTGKAATHGGVPHSMLFGNSDRVRRLVARLGDRVAPSKHHPRYRVFEAETFLLGGQANGAHHFEIGDRSLATWADGILGSAFFLRHRVFIDFARGELRFHTADRR